jgi:demethylmenaquinone methyltransferase/2-methoxy-6-polyprenyl-1,4-benzoquinol methylase
MTDANAFIRTAANFQPSMEPVVRDAIQALELPAGSHGLDAGCGTGLQTLLLAEAVGPGGHVTGVDISPAFLRRAEEWVKASPFAPQVSFREGDVHQLPFNDGTFDWAWSASCVGYAASIEPLPAVLELARVVRPGGVVALFAWSSETLLPGYPLLEAHLEATTSGIAPFRAGKAPDLHFLRALGWLRDVGLQDIKARTFVGEAAAPLSDVQRQALVELLDMRWPGVEAELAEEDSAAYRRLCLPESPQFIVDEPDYYAFFALTAFWGRVSTGRWDVPA